MLNKVALVTGASRGLGRSIATHLARSGVGIIGTYFSSKEAADHVARDIADMGGKAVMLRLDIGAPASLPDFEAAVQTVLGESFGRADLDFVVQNAGDGILKSFNDTNGDDLDRIYNVHFKGPYLLNRALVPMIARGGRILNVSSAATRFYLENHGAYAAMKAATEVITLYMAKELGERRVTVNVIAPGAIETDFANGVVRDNPDVNRIFSAATPLGRVGIPDDIGAAVNALLSDGFGWLNGQRIELTGGQSL
ncbi:SDR family NAD(P)-dependent oxidoreductase [Paraburkholderia caribensis]|uniref:SDR family NAD(P)-dependent oxidoreductase n=1 Tax=Paraburkholderia caribensis TaxID=75105 RepID=UPI00078C585A|nr:SDR family oxidoreductase [Paraburkholderia caribensis]AMV48276.1 hypothetical protein ATN79_47290 [Paraburkholderia caribensis]